MASADSDGRRPSQRARGTRTPRASTPSSNPTVRQRELGARLREFRNALGLTVEQVGEQLLCSATKISRLETGARRPSLRDVRDLCGIYGVTDPAEAAQLMELAKQAREPGWWTQYDDLRLDPYIGLEQEAIAITAFSMYYVPGLLQTAGYAKAIIRSISPKIDPNILQQRIEARLQRQKRFEDKDPPRYRALLDEASLYRHVGGPETMRGQLEKIIQLSEDQKISLQVVPFTVGGHGGADSNFELFEFGEETHQSPVVYVEGLYSQLYQERPAEIERYREAIDNLREAALSVRDSIALISKVRASQYST